MSRRGRGETAERSDILRRARRLAAMIRVAVVEDPESAHTTRIQGSQQRIVAVEVIAAAAFHITPKQVHAHEGEAHLSRTIECGIVVQDVNVYAQPRRNGFSASNRWVHYGVRAEFKDFSRFLDSQVVKAHCPCCRGAR